MRTILSSFLSVLFLFTTCDSFGRFPSTNLNINPLTLRSKPMATVLLAATLKSVKDTPLKVGLTGSIGMGKSTITNQLKNLGFPVFDADATVHKLYSVGGKAIEPLRHVCSSAIVDNAVDRKKLMEAIMKDSSNTLMPTIESIVHPLVEEEKFVFYNSCKQRYPIIFYDIPLLFESLLKRKIIDNSDKYITFDYVVTVTASAETQRQRVLSRPGMNEDKLNTILSKQVDDDYKRSHSDFLIFTDYPGYSEGKAQLAKLIDGLYDANKDNVVSSLNHGCVGHDCKAFILTDECFFNMEQLKEHRNIAFWDFIKTKMPNTFQIQNQYDSVICSLKQENPLLAHDDVEIEKLALKRLTKSPEELEHIDSAIQIKERSIHCYESYISERGHQIIEDALRHDYKVGLISAFPNIQSQSPNLKSKFETIVNYRELGTTETSVVPYMMLSNMWNLAPSQFRLFSTNSAAIATAKDLLIDCSM